MKTDLPDTPRLPQLVFASRFLAARSVPYHHHPCPELVLVTRGRCLITVGEKELAAKRGELFILPGLVPHKQVSDGLVGTVYVGFAPMRSGFNTAARTVDLKQDRHIRSWIQTLAELRSQPGDDPTNVAQGILLAVLARLERIEQPAATACGGHPRLACAIELIERNLTEPLSVGELARAVSLSASHLAALFREHVGSGPIKYQQSLRMGLARQKLAEPYLSVKEIAAACGYHDVNLFIRLFRQQHRMSPGRWRKTRQGVSKVG